MPDLIDLGADRTGRPEFPFRVGEPVGWGGLKAEVFQLPCDNSPRIRIRFQDGSYKWVWITELHVPPPLAPDVQAAADEMVTSGLLTNPQKIFGQGE